MNNVRIYDILILLIITANDTLFKEICNPDFVKTVRARSIFINWWKIPL